MRRNCLKEVTCVWRRLYDLVLLCDFQKLIHLTFSRWLMNFQLILAIPYFHLPDNKFRFNKNWFESHFKRIPSKVNTQMLIIVKVKQQLRWVCERSPARLLPPQIKYSSQLHFQNFVLHRTFMFALYQDFIQVSTQVSADFMKTKSPLKLHGSNKKRIIPQRKYESTYDITCGNNRDIEKHRQMKNFWSRFRL